MEASGQARCARQDSITARPLCFKLAASLGLDVLPLNPLKITAGSMFDFLKNAAWRLTWGPGRIPDLSGRVFIVTGGNSGLGESSQAA